MLLDTHVYLWWRDADAFLEPQAEAAIFDADEVYVSMASAWEIGIKVAAGKMKVKESFSHGIKDSQFLPLPIEFTHIDDLSNMPLLHRDPFDRIIVAQARVERLTLISRDPRVLAYDVASIVA